MIQGNRMRREQDHWIYTDIYGNDWKLVVAADPSAPFVIMRERFRRDDELVEPDESAALASSGHADLKALEHLRDEMIRAIQNWRDFDAVPGIRQLVTIWHGQLSAALRAALSGDQ